MQPHIIPILVDFIVYGVIIFIIAFIANARTKNLNDYVLGGRCFSGPITALGAGASDMSSWLLMALPGAVYLQGLNMLWMVLALILGAYCNWRFIAARLRVYTEIAADSLTIPEFLANRFQDKCIILRLVTAFAIISFFTFYAVSGFVAGAKLINLIFGMEYHNALLLSAGVIVAYTAIGGFLAVNWIDFFQGGLIFIALITVPAVGLLHHGSVDDAITEILRLDASYFNPLIDISFLGILSLFAWGLGYFGQLHINSRFMAISSVKELPIARRICMVWMTVALAGAMLTGMVGFLFFQNPPLTNEETVFIDLSRLLFNPWLTGIMLSAILSVIMSSLSAMILIIASILVEDLYRALLRKRATDKEYVLIGKISLLAAAVTPVIIALNPEITIFKAVGFAWSGLGSAFGPTLIFALFWRRMTKHAAIAGIAAGTLAVILWGTLSLLKVGICAHPGLLPGFEMLPGFLASSIAIVLVSKFTAAPGVAVTKEFDQVQALCRV